MGLNDVVEFAMTLEEAFGIEIEDPDAANMQTAGDLHRAVMKSVHRPDTEIWPAVVSVFEMNGIPPERIKPETRPRDLLGD